MKATAGDSQGDENLTDDVKLIEEHEDEENKTGDKKKKKKKIPKTDGEKTDDADAEPDAKDGKKKKRKKKEAKTDGEKTDPETEAKMKDEPKKKKKKVKADGAESNIEIEGGVDEGSKKKKRTKKREPKTDGEATEPEDEKNVGGKDEKKKKKRKREPKTDGEATEPEDEKNVGGKDEKKKKKKKREPKTDGEATEPEDEKNAGGKDEKKKKKKSKKKPSEAEEGTYGELDKDISPPVTETALVEQTTVESFAPTEAVEQTTVESFAPTEAVEQTKVEPFAPTEAVEQTKVESFAPTEVVEQTTVEPLHPTEVVEQTTVEPLHPTDEDKKEVSGESAIVEVIQPPEVDKKESSPSDILTETIKQEDEPISKEKAVEPGGKENETPMDIGSDKVSLIDDKTSEQKGAKLEVKKDKKKRSKSKEHKEGEKSKKKKDKSEVKDEKKHKKSKKHKEKGEKEDESPRETSLEISQEKAVVSKSQKSEEEIISEQPAEPETAVQIESTTDDGDGVKAKIGVVEVLDTENRPLEVNTLAGRASITEVVPFDANVEEKVEKSPDAAVVESVETPVEAAIDAPVEASVEAPVETTAEETEKTEENEEEAAVTPIIDLGDLLSRQNEEEPKLEFSWSEARRQRTPAEAQWQTWEAEDVEDNMEFDPEAEVGRLKGLVQEMEKMEVGDYYLSQFEDAARQDALMVGAIDIQEIQEEEQKLREQHLQFEEQEKARMASAVEELKEREKMAKERLAKQVRERRQQFSNDDTLFEQRQRYALDQLMKSFKRAEKQLMERLSARRAEVKALYGDLQTVSGKYDGSEGRRWKVDWDLTPQPIQINLKTLRGVKNKLPAGHYVLMVSLYNRLGGMPLRWSRHKDQLWGGSTVPISHSGHFYNVEMKVDQSVFTALPPRPDIKPGMVLVFELFLLRGAVVPVDVVVGWGCFPICDGKFRYIEGKYKTPMLRGPMDPGIDSHEGLEYSLALDLDNWLCNMYFELKCLPRYLAGQKEYEVELQFSSQLLGFPDRIEVAPAEGEIKNPDCPIFDEITNQTLEEATEVVERDSGSVQLSPRDEVIEEVKQPIRSGANSRKNSTMPGSSSQTGSDSSQAASAAQLQDDEFKKKKGSISTDPESTVIKIPMDDLSSTGEEKKQRAYLGSRALRAWQMRQRKVAEDDPDFPWHVMYNLGEQEEHDYAPLLGEPGIYYKYHRCTPREDYQTHLNTLLPRTPGLRQTTRKLKGQRSVLSDLELHTYTVDNGFNASGHRLHHSSRHRMAYINRMLMSELGLSQWRASKFWITIFLLILCFFITMYVHYCGQWIFLTSLGIPINRFDFYPYTVALNYQASLLTPAEQIAVVLMGPLWVLIIFVLLMLLALVCILAVHRFPELCSQFILTYGVMTLLDPLLIMIVDVILGREYDVGGGQPIADFAKLYYMYLQTQGTGLAGILLTVLIYFAYMLLTLLALYVFFIRLYNMGRILDVYWRLHGKEEKFLVPMDLEVSGLELAHLVKRAEMWRGDEGERRKISVTDYIWEEELAEDEEEEERQKKEEVTTHVAIHTIHLDGLQEIYRHFLRLPEGAIIEVFGDSVGLSTMHENLTLALQQGAKDIEAQQLPKMEMSVIEQQMLMEDGDGKKENKEGEGRPSILLPWNVGGQEAENDDTESSKTQKASSDSETKNDADQTEGVGEAEAQKTEVVEETSAKEPSEEIMVAVDQLQTEAVPGMDKPQEESPRMDKPQEESPRMGKPQETTLGMDELQTVPAVTSEEGPRDDAPVYAPQGEVTETATVPITSQPTMSEPMAVESERMEAKIEGDDLPGGDAVGEEAKEAGKTEKKKKKKKKKDDVEGAARGDDVTENEGETDTESPKKKDKKAKKKSGEDGAEDAPSEKGKKKKKKGKKSGAEDEADDEPAEGKKKKKKKGKKSEADDGGQTTDGGASDGEELIKKKKKKKKGKD